MLVLSLFATILPVLIVGFVSFKYSASAVQREVNQSNIHKLDSVSSAIDSALDRIQNNTVQMLLGSFFKSDLDDFRHSNYAGFYSSIAQNLAALQNANKEASDASFYMADDGFLISPVNGGHRISGETEREALKQELSSEEQIKWVIGPYPYLPGYNQDGITLISKVPLYSKKPIGIMFIRIDEPLFRNLMRRFISYSDEEMFILDESGRLVSSSSGGPVPKELFERAEKNVDIKQSFTLTWKNLDYLVTPTASKTNNWRYFNMVPIQQLNAKSKGIAYITLGMVALCLILGAITVFWGTRRVYRPIANLVNHLKDENTSLTEADEMSFVRKRWMEINQSATKLEQQLSAQFPVMREIFALQLLQGHHLHDSEEQLDLMLQRYAVPRNSGSMVLVIASDIYSAGRSPFKESDRELIVFAMKNIATDWLSFMKMDGFVINLLNDQIAVWLFLDQAKDEVIYHELKPHVEQLRSLISGYLRLPVTIGLSGQTDRIAELPELYEEAVLAVRSRIVVGGNQVIANASGGMASELRYRYPIEIETHFENSLRLGDRDEAERMLDEFAKTMRDIVHKPDLIHMSYYRLLTAAIHSAYLLGLDTADLFGNREADPYGLIRASSTIGELNEWFKEHLIEPVVSYVQGKQQREHEQLIQKVVKYIEVNYHFDLSLDQCAQICGLSPHYLSRLFKKTMDVSFIEYLSKYRIDKSKELLGSTNLTVAEIAEKVGYQMKNFIRVFKKHEGVTPGQYRGATDNDN